MSRTSGTDYYFLETIKSDGINVIEQINEHITPMVLTRDKVRIKVLAPSVRKRNGIEPATVVPVVASKAGIFRLSVKNKLSALIPYFVCVFSPSAQRIAALTVMPLAAINAQATAGLNALPEITRKSAGIDKETGTVASISNGKEKDSLIDAITI
jgi:hypothetical protein